MSDTATMNTNELEQIKRYIQYADKLARNRRQGRSLGWWVLYVVFVVITLVALVTALNSATLTLLGPSTHDLLIGAFLVLHALVIWIIIRQSKHRLRERAGFSETLRYDRDNPAVGQICAAIMRPSAAFKVLMGIPATGAWKPDMRPIFRIIDVAGEKMLTLQLIRTADQKALGKVFHDVPYYEVEAIET